MKSMGSGPLAVYVKLRVARARWMLKSHHSLRVAAVETGFSYGSQLNAAFKRIYGLRLRSSGNWDSVGDRQQRARDAQREERVSTSVGEYRFASPQSCPVTKDSYGGRRIDTLNNLCAT